MALTQAGAKFYIAVDVSDDPVAQNSDLDQTGYEALTWLEVSQVGNVGETGTNTNIVSYDTLSTEVTQKGKGISNAGDPDIECARVGDDPGQIAMRAAAATTDSYAFKYELDNMPSGGSNGTIYYNRGLVTGPRHPNGGNEDFDLEIYSLGLNQKELVVEAV
tara:strand:+ start:6270 stop:6755 length:486 start_codon:yes stop_codon:yes gene_type:complete